MAGVSGFDSQSRLGNVVCRSAVDTIHAQVGRDVISTQSVATPSQTIASNRSTHDSVSPADVDRCFNEQFGDLAALLTEALSA